MGFLSTRLVSLFLSKPKPLANPNPNLLIPVLHHLRFLCSSPSAPSPSPNDIVNPFPRSRTPLEKQFDSWASRLRDPADGGAATISAAADSDPDLALDLFRWSSLLPGGRHPSAYLAALRAAVKGRRFPAAESLLSDVLAGAVPPDRELLHTALRFAVSRRHLLSTALDLFNLMRRHPSTKPTLESYSVVLSALLKRFSKPPICFVYLRTFKILVRQMKSSGIVLDTFASNLIIKAHSKCLEMDEAVRVFKEMGLYGCDPNEYSYGYLAKGLCEKGMVEEGFGYFTEMREKGFVPTSSVYMALVCGLAMERRFEEAVRVLFDMVDQRKRADLLTYRTLLEGLCRDGRGDDAFGLLEELGRREGGMDRRMYSDLMDGLHWLNQPHE